MKLVFKDLVSFGIVVFFAFALSRDALACKKTIYVDRFREKYSDDTELLRYVFNNVSNNTVIVFGPRTYYVNSLEYQQGSLHERGFIELNSLKNIVIQGNGAMIIDRANKQRIGLFPYAFMRIENCSDVSINGLHYVWLEKCDIHPSVKGIVFIRAMGECKNMVINVSVDNAGRGFSSGLFAYQGSYGRGICDSKITIRTENVGYPLAICGKGDNLELECYYNIAHRGVYLGGVTNTKVRVVGKEAYSTRVQLLLTDTSDKDGWWPCDRIDATVIDLGTHEYSKSVLPVVYQFYQKSYESFANRPSYDIKDIRLHIFTPIISGTNYEVFQFAGDVRKGDKVNVSIDGKLNHKDDGGSRLFRLNKLPRGMVSIFGLSMAHNYILQMEDVPDDFILKVENCDNIILEEKPMDHQSSGRIQFIGCSFRRPIVKRVDGFYVESIIQ